MSKTGILIETPLPTLRDHSATENALRQIRVAESALFRMADAEAAEELTRGEIADVAYVLMHARAAIEHVAVNEFLTGGAR